MQRIILALATCMFMFFSTAVTAGPPDHAKGKGAPAQKFYWEDVLGDPGSFTFPLYDCGDFVAEVTVTFSGFWIYHPETAGRGAFEFYHSAWAARISNSAYPDMYFIDGIPGQVMNRHWSGDPFVSDFTETGVQLMVTLPGHGVVYRDVGRLSVEFLGFNDNGTPDDPSDDFPMFEFGPFTGQWDSFDPEADPDFEAICEALTPPE